MAFEPQRFIHAANVRLDVPVSVQTSETLTDELRVAFEDATLTSFDDVIHACVDHAVDFLLLSGNIFIEADRSLRARLALLKGFRQLSEKNIPVYILPGDADPPEAWRAIPELPDNVFICFSSNPEPLEVNRNGRTIATVSASMWYGETDAFGIQVISETVDGIQPFRIAPVSQAKYEESQRMAAMAAEANDDLLDETLQSSATAERLAAEKSQVHGTLVPLSGKPRVRKSRPAGTSDDDESEWNGEIYDVDDSEPGSEPSDEAETTIDGWDEGFIAFVDEMLTEGRLNYLALTGELERSTLNRPLGTMHCPGTTQPRSHHETSDGSCSLVEIGTDGLQRIRTIDTSSVDWKHIEVTVREHTTLTAMLQMLKAELLEQNVGSSDRIWSVHWTLRCSVPVMRELIQEDLAVAVAVELDELKRGTRTIQLLHDVVLIPLEWQLSDANHLAQRYSRLINDDARLIESELKQLIEDDSELSVGWRHRLTALLSGIDAERIFGRMRSDGADWFLPDLEEFETLQRTASPRDISEGASQSEDDEWTDEDFTEEDAVDVLMSDDELSAEEDVPSDDEQFDDDPDFDEEYNNVDPDDDEEDFEDEDDVAGGAA